MNEHSSPPVFPGELSSETGLSRLRASMGDSLFEISLAFPKLLALRSTPGAWTAFRFVLGGVGAGLVVLPLSLWNGWAFAPVGLALFLLAVLLPPIRQDRGTAKAVEQLGAYQVLDGGRLSSEALETPPVSFYLTRSRVWALDQDLRPQIVIPAEEITLVNAFPSRDDWVLRVNWQSNSAEFLFDGLFAERRARLAEQGLRHLVQPVPLGRARAKAAGA